MVMSKQRRAPGALESVRRFVNTRQIGHGTELLSEPAALGRWLEERALAPAGLRVTRADLARAIELREALRTILVAHTYGGSAPPAAYETLEAAAGRARLRLGFDPDDTATLIPAATGVAGALGRLVAIVHEAIALGIWTRLKACRDDACEWAFYDHTKNRSGTWCSMDGCGNRAKARAYRERHAGAGRIG
jgi:predicted RNA-binding Zn ribbon-like protein